jgi:hypothetical protein
MFSCFVLGHSHDIGCTNKEISSAAPEAATDSISSPPLSLPTAAPSGWSGRQQALPRRSASPRLRLKSLPKFYFIVQLVAGALKSLPNFYLTVKLDFALPGHSSPCQTSTSLCNLSPGHSSPCQTSTSPLNLTPHSAAYAGASASEAEQEKYHPQRHRQPQTPFPRRRSPCPQLHFPVGLSLAQSRCWTFFKEVLDMARASSSSSLRQTLHRAFPSFT